MNQQPLGNYDGQILITPESRRSDEKKYKERKLKWYTIITKEKNGTISGLTEMLYHSRTPHKGYQNLTGVKEEYQSRKLGKWLKAHMLMWFYDKYSNIK